jgi:uncharacterized protein
MSLIIDGHNLIGVLPDIHLSQPDDEARLLGRLRAYRARSRGRSMIVFFDAGPAAGPGPALPAQFSDPSSPGIQVRFSALGQTADDAIVEYLQGRAQPGQYAVVTNDQGLAWRVRDAGASVLRASDFAAKLTSQCRAPRGGELAAPAANPRDPAFADIYAGFIESEKNQARFQKEQQTDASMWIERLYDGDPQLAERATQWLGQFGGPAALEALRDALTHEHAGVRAAALLALGVLGDPVALPDLCRCLADDANSMVREAAAQSLGRMGNRTVEAALETAVRSDTKGKVRKAAQAALEQVRARRGDAARLGDRPLR